MVRLALLFAILAALCARQVHAQSVPITNPPNTPNPDSTLLVPQRDITDILKSLIGRSVQTEVVREPHHDGRRSDQSSSAMHDARASRRFE